MNMTSRPRKRRMGLVITCKNKHKIDWDSRQFLEIEKDWRRRKIKEALYIDSINPQEEMNPSKLMNPEKGTEISDCGNNSTHTEGKGEALV